jgi:membrane-bound serine protease (ClpP class)
MIRGARSITGCLVSIALTAAGLSAFQTPPASPAPDNAPLVLSAEIDGIIHPVAAQFVQRTIERAEREGAALVVFTLRTPGGLVDATRDINNAIIRSRPPVAVFVGPSGNRAASAGFLITIAADIAAMAPGTHIGAAHPVAGNGEKIDETMAKKMASDVASYARTLATQRHRNVELVEKGVTESRSFTEQEAVGAKPPLVDLIASNVDDLIGKLDGRTVTRFDGRTQRLQLKGARIEAVEMTWAQRALSALAHPQIAYMLLTLGMLGLTVEFWSPGAIFPGVAGGICLLLAFFAFQVLPVNYAAVALIAFGIALLILEVKVTSYGALALGGIISLLLGSMMLIDSPLPELQLGLRFIIPIVGSVAGLLLLLVGMGVRAQQTRAATGVEGMIDEIGRALTAIEPGAVGRVRTHGEIWTATAHEPVAAGQAVRVVGVNGLLLTVKPESSIAAQTGELQ